MTIPHSIEADFLIIGAGIAGASVGYWLSPHGKVVVLEREAQPGYHSTGRSAALFMEAYGPPQVRALTLASRAFLERLPAEFFAYPVLHRPRGVMLIAAQGDEAALEQEWQALRDDAVGAQRLDAAGAHARVPILRKQGIIGALLDPGAADMDVHVLHQGFLRGIRQRGGSIVCNAEVAALEYKGGAWCAEAGGVCYRAPIVLNAAGAWADVLAERAGVRSLGLQPRRRSAMTFAAPSEYDTADWPATAGIHEDWYFKPDAGVLLGSSANADPVAPHDVQPEEVDIATAIDRIQQITTLTIRRPMRTWAGLRSFVADGGLVGGFDPQAQGFFWVAAQGGYGIQTSAAMGEACAALARGLPLPERIARFGLSAEALGPARLFAAPLAAAAATQSAPASH